MNDKKIFPLFFILEKVTSGFILTAREVNGSPSDDDNYHKEVVIDKDINARIGKLLHLNAIEPGSSVMFHVEATSEGVYKLQADGQSSNRQMEARLAFVHFRRRSVPDGTIVALCITDTKTIEIYGDDAMQLSAKDSNFPIVRIGGYPLLSFPMTRDGQKALALLCPNVNVIKISEDQVLNWYNTHQVQIVDPKN